MRESYAKIISVFILCSLFLAPALAQSNLTYGLKVGATGENSIVKEFPEIYNGEKINISLRSLPLSDTLDFVFASGKADLQDKFDSIYTYQDAAGVSWTVWKNKKEIKNRSQRVLVGNAYKVFEEYVVSHTAAAKRSTGWIWWLFAVWVAAAVPYVVFFARWYFRKMAYICPQCHAVFQPSVKEGFLAKHTPAARKLTCPSCGHFGYCVEIAAETEEKADA